ncbi:uncharacterized protein [Diabrotica undecimpunctata]|uniref:uncharacterized protein n=1 Tax=Diabrotica undecimpunctata TaxID=50387 RepID=UPI003B63320D
MKYFVLLLSIVAIKAIDLQGTAVDQCLCRDQLNNIYNQVVDSYSELQETNTELDQLEADMEDLDDKLEGQNEKLEELESELATIRYIQLSTIQELISQQDVLECIINTVDEIDVQVHNQTTHVNNQTVAIGELKNLTLSIQQCNDVNSCVAPS